MTDNTTETEGPQASVVAESQQAEADEAERQALRNTTDSLQPPSNADLVDVNDLVDLPEPFTEFEEVGAKLQNLMQVVHNSLVPQLVATPLVYLQDSKWKLQSHSDFRARKRKQLETMIDVLKTKKDIDYAKIMEEFESILIEVFNVRLPAMPEYYASDNSFQRVPVTRAIMGLTAKIQAAKLLGIKERANAHATALTQWYTYSPVGRPHVYLSDDHWSLASESEMRKFYRQQIASQLFTAFT